MKEKKVDSITLIRKPVFRSYDPCKNREETVRFFRENGFVIIPGILSADEIAEIRKIGQIYFDTKNEIELFSSDFLRENVLCNIPFKDRVVEALRFFYDKPYAVYPNFTLRTNLFTRWHIDKAFWNKDTITYTPEFDHIQCALYLQDNTTENPSGFDVVPGSHLNGIRIGGVQSPVTRFFRHVKNLITKPVSIKAKAGDLIFFDARLIHQGTQAGKSRQPKETKMAIYWSVSSDNPVLIHNYSKYLSNKATNLKYENSIQSPDRFNDICNIRYPENYQHALSQIEKHKINVITLKK